MTGNVPVDAAAPAWHRLPWWDIIFVVVCSLAIATVVLFDANREPPRPWSTATVVALLVGVLVVWFSVGRRHVRAGRPGYASLVAIAALMIAAMTIAPPLGILQGALYPYLWSVLENTRRSIVASGLVAGSVFVLGVVAAGPAAVPVLVITQSLSLLLSIGIGLAITYAWNVAEHRQRVLDELGRSQQRVAELSRLQGVSHERERLSRELHDTLAQSLAGLTLLAGRASRSARRAVDSGESLEPSLATIDQVAELARTALAETRALIAESAPVHGVADAPGDAVDVGGAPGAVARAAAGAAAGSGAVAGVGADARGGLGTNDGLGASTGPGASTGSGASTGTTFRAALTRLAERFRRETEIEIGLALPAAQDGTDPLEAVPRDLQVVLLRCLQEGLANVRRHARASRADVRLDVAATHTTLDIADDGLGFDAASIPDTGFGLPGLRDRARLLDGDVDVESAPGTGTRVRVRLPYPAPTHPTHPSLAPHPPAPASQERTR